MKKILIVDDEQDIAILLEKYLKRKSLNVCLVLNPEEAEQTIIQEQPDLIFMDYRMVPITGKDLLERLHYLKLQIPIVMMSAYRTLQGYYDMRKLGAVEYIAKPYDFEEVDRILEKYLHSSH